MSFIQLIRIIVARRNLLAAVIAACLLAGLIAIAVIPAKYEAHSRVLLDLVKPDPVTQQVLSTNFARAYITTQSELITDYRVAGNVVDALGWARDPAKVAAYNSSDAKGKVELRRWLAEQIIENTVAKPLVDSNIMEISYRARTPDEARRVADLIRDSYVEQSIAFRQEGATRNAEWFRQQARKIARELTSVEQQKSTFEKENGVVLQNDYSDPDSERLKALAAQVPMQGGAVIAPVTTPSSAQLAQVDAQISTLSTSLGPNHPQIVALRQQRVALASAAAQERSAALAASRAASAGGPPIASQVAAQQARVLSQRNKIDELRKIQAQVDVLRDQYNKTMARAGELSLEAASRESGLTLLGNAVAPDTPVSPKIALILLGALGGGIGLGLLLAIVSELLKRRVRSVEDLSTASVPVIGRLMSEA